MRGILAASTDWHGRDESKCPSVSQVFTSRRAHASERTLKAAPTRHRPRTLPKNARDFGGTVSRCQI